MPLTPDGVKKEGAHLSTADAKRGGMHSQVVEAHSMVPSSIIRRVHLIFIPLEELIPSEAMTPTMEILPITSADSLLFRQAYSADEQRRRQMSCTYHQR